MTARGRGWVLSGQTRPCAHSRVEGAEEALDLAVPARRAGRDEDVPGAELGERVAELVAAWRSTCALSLMTAWTGPQPCSRIHAAARRSVAETVARSRRVHLAVGQAGVVVDDADDTDLAGVARVRGARRGRRVPSGRAGRTSAARTRRCATAPRPRSTHSAGWSAARLRRDAASAVTREDLPDRRAVPAAEELQLHRAPVRALAGIENLLFFLHSTTARDNTRAPEGAAHTTRPTPAHPPIYQRSLAAVTLVGADSSSTWRSPAPSRRREGARSISCLVCYLNLHFGLPPPSFRSSCQTRTLRRRPDVSSGSPLSPQADHVGRGFRVQPLRS